MPRKKFANRWWELSKTLNGIERVFCVEFAIYSNQSSMRRGIRNHRKWHVDFIDGEGVNKVDPSDCYAICTSWIHKQDDGTEMPVSRIFMTRDAPFCYLTHEAMHAALFCYRHFHQQNPMSNVSLISNEEALADIIEGITHNFTMWRDDDYIAKD